MSLLVVGLRNDGLDPSGSQVASDRAGRVCLVASDRVRAGARAARVAADPQVRHQWEEHRKVTGLSGRDQSDQREPVAVDELVDLRGQPTAGAADAVIRRLFPQILVTRSSPL